MLVNSYHFEFLSNYNAFQFYKPGRTNDTFEYHEHHKLLKSSVLHLAQLQLQLSFNNLIAFRSNFDVSNTVTQNKCNIHGKTYEMAETEPKHLPSRPIILNKIE